MESHLLLQKYNMKLYIVGFGPGKLEGMTIEAKNAIEASDIVIGYTVYVNIIKKYFPKKEYFDTAMRQEKERVKKAIEICASGKDVVLVCSGDSVVYGMAGLAYELLKETESHGVEIQVIAGVTAALSGSAVLGAPLTHDFCVISLSDLLTPWEKIEKRLEAAAIGDFAIAIYNPSSKKRADYLEKACNILLKYISENTVCGYVTNIGREGESFAICTLRELKNIRVDMFTTVFVGNSQTLNIDGHMVTPRGYRL